jgi:elongation factor G
MEVNVEVPPPVFFCTVEPPSDAEEKRLNFALACLQREDPSLKVLINEEENLGQTIIQGMGELHLEIVKDRLLKEYKLNATFGPLNIAYKEMPTLPVTEAFTFERNINDNRNYVQLELEVTPKAGCVFESAELNLKDNEQFQNKDFPFEFLESINNGVRSALNKGVLLRYPIVNCDVRLNAFSSNAKIHLPFISSAAYQCMNRALKNASCVISQPIMQVEVFLNCSSFFISIDIFNYLFAY